MELNVSPSISVTCFVVGVMLFLWAIDYAIEDRKRRKRKIILQCMDEYFKKSRERRRYHRKEEEP